jgi:hypothetical protein
MMIIIIITNNNNNHFYGSKCKGKTHPRTGHEGPDRE